MLSLSLKTESKDISVFKKIISDGISEERKKIEYALNKTNEIIGKMEKKYKISSEEFMCRFEKNKIEENDDSFNWWAEIELAKELK